MQKKQGLIFIIVIIISGCATLAVNNFSPIFGEAHPRNRIITKLAPQQVDYWQHVKPVLESRCVVCHACYDASCQLKLSAIEGIERGASKAPVYDSTRLLSGDLTRLFEDGHSVDDWRKKGFFPVLNEYEQSIDTNKQAGLIYQFLQLKEQHPLPQVDVLDDSFTFGLKRKDYCPLPETFTTFAEKNPLWGMPYALPNLANNEQTILKKWLENGAKHTMRNPMPLIYDVPIKQWESLLNQDSLKAQLISRYIYEHVFLAHLYFEDISKNTFFKLVRSATPPGQSIQQIATRRPYDDPGVKRVYYRFMPELETIVRKTHLPYALNESRMQRWGELFFDAAFEVKTFPSYGTPQAENPFDSFAQLPMKSRYKFMLDEAHFIIMNFIKGPVCHGSAALDVINDHFWVFFIDPDAPFSDDLASAIFRNKDDLGLANASDDSYLPLIEWHKYAKQERKNRSRTDAFLLESFKKNKIPLNLKLIWDGTDDSKSTVRNQSAALTIFRHFDSATVKKGLIGEDPETAWVISYPLLERIYYLLVAGYDVYGNLSHNLLSRLDMDFLRMDGETSFLMFLPQATRDKERLYWYRNASQKTLEYLHNSEFEQQFQPDIPYKTDNPKQELFALLKEHLGVALTHKFSLEEIDDTKLRVALKSLGEFSGEHTQLLAEVSLINIIDRQKNSNIFVTLLRNTAHLNITSILRESKNLIPAENTITVAKGFIGEYPNVFMQVNLGDINVFVEQVLAMQSADDYHLLLNRFGVRRTNERFWQHSDSIHKALREDNITDFGLLDYNRLENR